MDDLKSNIDKYITNKVINKKIHEKMNNVCINLVKDVLGECNAENAKEIEKKFTDIIQKQSRKCCYIKTGNIKCTNSTDTLFCKTHKKYEKDIINFSKESCKSSFDNYFDNYLEIPTEMDYSNYTKKFINDSFYYIQNDIILDKNLERVGYITNDICLFDFE